MTEPARPGHSAPMALAMQPPRASPGGLQEAAAFAEVYEQHFDFVWRSLRRLGVGPSALDDAVQEVFLVVHRRLAEFEGRSSLKTWLFGISLKVAQRVARNQARHPATELPEPATLGSTEPTPQDEVARREAIALLYAILDELDDEKRAVFVMVELEQLSAPEIAEELGIPLNTVYSRLRAARREFEASLKRQRARERWRQTDD
jgi:RNA polymerase sigma-70 factor (ECF subfamily)